MRDAAAVNRGRLWALATALISAACGDALPDENLALNEEAITVCAGSTTVPGVDVSHWEGSIDWAKAKAASIRFGIAKATQGTYNVDSQFTANWKNMKTAGVIRGAFHFIDWTEDPVKQADFFVATVTNAGGFQAGDLPPVLDVEETPAVGGGFQTPDIKKVLPWLQRVECLTGRKPMVYTRASFIDPLNPPSAVAAYPLWLAQYTSGCPNTPKLWSDWVIWQTTDAGSINGIPGAVDLDVFKGSLSQLQAFAGEPWGGGCAGAGGTGSSGGGGGSPSGGGGSPSGGGGSPSSGGGSPNGGGGSPSGGGGSPSSGGAGPVSCDLSIGASGLVLEEDGPCGSLTGEDYASSDGHDGHAYWTSADVPAPDYVDGIFWLLNFSEAGTYRLRAWIPDAIDNRTSSVDYKIQHAGTASKVSIDQSTATGWIELGSYDFATGGEQWVRLGDYFTIAADQGKRVVFDALEVSRIAAANPAGGGAGGSSWGSGATIGKSSPSGTGGARSSDEIEPSGCSCRTSRENDPSPGLAAILAFAFALAARRSARNRINSR